MMDAVPTASDAIDVPELQHHVGNLIRRAQQLHQATWARVASAEISSAQYSMLLVLDRLGEASQRELCDHVDLDRSTVTHLVRRLEQSGLIERRRADGDARRNVVTLTKRGAAERIRLTPLVAEVQRELTRNLDGADAVALERALRLMLDARTAEPRS
jgi:DNA-binding MarR family transcriptional regulator